MDFIILSRDIPDLHNSVDYLELQEVIERKELFDSLLEEIISETEVCDHPR
jgi:hypothetical protein